MIDRAKLEHVADQFAPAYNLTDLLTERNQEHAEKDLDFHAVRDAWRKFLGEVRRDEIPPPDLHYYLHVPYCRAKCRYCGYYSVPLPGRGALEDYLSYVMGAMDFFADTLKGFKFQTLYIGGGTPSLMTPAQLERLLERLFKRYEFDLSGETAFEVNPDSATRPKLDVLARYGFNRISMGVQSLRREVLANENRGYQANSKVADVIRWVMGMKCFLLNVDLLLGMQGDTREGFLETFRTLVGLGPDQITVYPITPTTEYLAEHYGGRGSRFYEDLRRRYKGAAERASEFAREAGYNVDPTHNIESNLDLEHHAWSFVRPPKIKLRRVYSDISPRCMGIMGVGPTSRCRIAGHLYYRQSEEWSAPFDPKRRLCRSLPLSWRDEMRKFIFQRIWTGHPVDRKEFKTRFRRDVVKEFSSTLAGLKKDGAAAVGRDAVRFTGGSNRANFLAALRFLEPRRIDEIYTADIPLKTPKGTLTVRLENVRETENYLARESGRGLRVTGDPAKLLPAGELERALELICSLFGKLAAAAGKRGDAGVPRLARDYRKSLKDILSSLHKKKLLKCLRLAP